MRVALIDSSASLQSLVWRIARELVEIGVTPVIVGASPISTGLERAGVEFVRSPSVSRWRTNLLTHVTDHLALAATAVRASASDLFYTTDSVASAAMALVGAGARTVWHGHGNVLHHSQFVRPYDAEMYRLMLWSSRFAGPRMGRVAVLGAGVAKWWRRFGVDAKRIVVVPNGIDLPETTRDPGCVTATRSPDDASRLLYVGRLSPEKGGVDNLLRAVKLLDDAGTSSTLDIVGDGPLRPELEAIAARIDIAHRVTFWGTVDFASVANFYRRADLVVLPSRGEMMPRVMLEAWSHGTPFLATPVGAIPDYLSDGSSGFLLHDASPRGIAERVARALGDRERLARVSREGERMAAQLSWRNTAESLVTRAFEPMRCMA